MDSVHAFELVLGLLVVIVALTALAEKFAVPYPIALVLGGLGLAMIPGLPDARLNPDLVFILFLPPVLYGAAWSTSWRDFRKSATTASYAVKFPSIPLVIAHIFITYYLA